MPQVLTWSLLIAAAALRLSPTAAFVPPFYDRPARPGGTWSVIRTEPALYMATFSDQMVATSPVSSKSSSSSSSTTTIASQYDVILYDGVCNFCNAWVDILLRLDVQQKFRFAPLQSKVGQALLTQIGKQADDISSVVLIKKKSGTNNKREWYDKSRCVLQVVQELGPVAAVASRAALAVVPEQIRDSIYDTVAQNRYNFMGKRDECRCSDPQFAHRFLLDDDDKDDNVTASTPWPTNTIVGFAPTLQRFTAPQSSLFLFDIMFEQDGPLGKGITVGKVQVALAPSHRGSVFTALQRATEQAGSTQYDLACLVRDIALDLLRRSDEWVGAASDSRWFKEDDAGKAESLFNQWANQQAVKFEKEYLPQSSQEDDTGPSTIMVVSILMEICGDQTDFDGAGYSMAETKEVLQSIASNAMVEDGDFVNAVEVFWAPGDNKEVLSKHDLIVDFPELITL